jgi:VanZ family protein
VTGLCDGFEVILMALSLRRKLTIISLLVYWPGLFVFAHIPIPLLVYKAQVSDKSLHFLAYLVLVFLFWFAISPDRKVDFRHAPMWLVLFVVVCYGAIDELAQRYVGRMSDLKDFYADLAGIGAGFVIVGSFTFWPGLLVVTGIAVFLLTNLARVNPAELLPRTSTIFYLGAYAFFTMVWILYMHLFVPLKAPRPKWLIAALILPVGFLAIVKLFSVILEKPFSAQSVVISAGAIVAVVLTAYGIALFRGGFERIQSDSV